jgi:hypothetical protein
MKHSHTEWQVGTRCRRPSITTALQGDSSMPHA